MKFRKANGFDCFYEHNDDLFIIKREIPIHNFIKKGETTIDMTFVKVWRDWLNVPHVLRTQKHFLFVLKVDDCEEVDDGEEANNICLSGVYEEEGMVVEK
jgi:hypothetical protein